MKKNKSCSQPNGRWLICIRLSLNICTVIFHAHALQKNNTIPYQSADQAVQHIKMGLVTFYNLISPLFIVKHQYHVYILYIPQNGHVTPSTERRSWWKWTNGCKYHLHRAFVFVMLSVMITKILFFDVNCAVYQSSLTCKFCKNLHKIEY